MEHRVYLRAFEIDDYKTSIHWRQDDTIWSMLGGPKYFVSEAYEKKWIENEIFNSRDVKLAVCLIESNKHIGNVYFTDINQINQSCHSHVLIGEKDCWGKGYAKEALLLGIDYMVNQRNIHRFKAKILESNNASLKMHQKCGFEIEGLLRQSVYKDGQFQNQYITSLIK